MGGLLIFLGICVVIGAIPALITYFVVGATKAEETLFSSSSESIAPIQPPPSQSKETAPVHCTTNEQLAQIQKPDAKHKKAGSSGFLVFIFAVPAIGIAIEGLGLCIFLLAIMMSIAAFGYSGFFDLAFATMKFGGIVFLIGIPVAVLGGIAFGIGKIFD